MDRNSWEQDVPATADAEQFGDIIEPVTTADAGGYDVVLVGEPYDRGTVTRRGARDGPAAIRMALADVDTHHLDAGPVDSVGDVGSIEIPFGASVATAREPVRETVDALHDSDAVPLILGGDSSLTVANVAKLLGADAATDGGYATDGGFGDDDESVGDVEHFDPAAADDSEREEQAEDDSEAEGNEDDTETAGAPEEDESEESDDAEAGDEETEETPEIDDEGDSEADDETDEDADEESEETTEQDETDEGEETGSEEVVDDSGTAETGFDTSEQSETEVVEETAVTGSSTASSGGVGVIRLSARLDCQAVGSELTNRSAVRQLFRGGVDSLAVVGARHFESATAEADAFRDNGGEVVTAEEVGDDPVEAADRALGTVQDAEHVYVSIDLSVLDATAAPGASDPSPGGLQTRELFRVVRLLASDDRIAGLELVETAPAHDRDDQTAEAAARTAAHAIAALRE